MTRRPASSQIAGILLGGVLAGLGAFVLLSSANGRVPSNNTQATSPISPASSSTSTQVEVVIDNAQEHQRMDGFGAYNKSLWYGGPAGDTLGTLRTEAINTVYNKVKLNTGNIDASLLESPGDYNQRRNDNNDPSTFDWRGFQTQSVDAAKRLLIDLAQPYGFNDYYIEQRINIKWASPWLGGLRGTNYGLYLDEAAEQVAAGAIYWRNTHKIVPKYLMLFNEPLTGNGELAGGSLQQVADIVKRAGARLRSEGFSSMKFVLPNEETVSSTFEVMEAVLKDPQARQYVGAIGYHTYPYGSVYTSIPKILKTSGTGNPDAVAVAERNKLRDLGKRYGVPLWMTEISHGDVDPRSFDALRGRAIHIHDELVYADASAYMGMHNMWDMTSHKLHFGNSNLFSEDGAVVLVDNPSGTIYITGLGYAIGHYARWIKKGAVRVEATSSDPLVQLTAFRDDNLGRLVLVAINNALTVRTLTVNVNGLTLSGDLTGEQSTTEAYWQPLTPFALTSPRSFTVTVPGMSVTTVAGRVAGGAPEPVATGTSLAEQSATPLGDGSGSTPDAAPCEGS